MQSACIAVLRRSLDATSHDRRRVAPARIAPLAPERYRIQLTVSRETHDKFRRAQALLRHAVPSGDAAEIFDRAITLLVEESRAPALRRDLAAARVETGRRALAPHSRPLCAERSGGATPAAARSLVAEGRCRETAFLEFHHVEPYAAGGAATVANIQLRCRAHNAYEAGLFFGDGVVREITAGWGELVPERVAGGQSSIPHVCGRGSHSPKCLPEPAWFSLS